MDKRELKLVQMYIRVSPEQKQKIINKADKVHMNLMVYLLQTSLCKAPPLTQAELEQLRYRLDRNGRQLNELVRFFNTYEVMDGGSLSLCHITAPSKAIVKQVRWLYNNGNQVRQYSIEIGR